MTPVYLDPVGHLWSADRDTLHLFALTIGMRRSWFQDRPVLYHYDLMTARKRAAARFVGAVEISSRDLVRMMRASDQAGRP